jgi:hypothetical protein
MRPALFTLRMTALDLCPAAVAQSEPATNCDLQSQCARCKNYQRCERDLRCDPDSPTWRAYCPCAELLDALAEQWWLKYFI